MSFFIVPSMLYQQQQKMKQKAKTKPSRTVSQIKPLISRGSETGSLLSGSLADESTHSSNESVRKGSEGGKSKHSFLRRGSSQLLSESSQLIFPSLTSRRASVVSETSRHLSVGGINPSFTPSKLSQNVFGTENANSITEVEIPEYVPFIDSSVFNTEESIRKTFINPNFTLQRFEVFLDVISNHHVNDPINFASVREQLLMKFLLRRNIGLRSHWNNILSRDRSDRLRIEDLLGHELLKCRSYMRTALKRQLTTKSSYRKLACEHLIQGNFTNYVRYILALPECPARQAHTLTDFQKKDYEIKRVFADTADALYALKTDNYEGDILTVSSRVELLVKAITKSAFDFILLEKYAVQILMKLNNNFLIEARITKHLFNLYNLNLQLKKQEALKVLVFNGTFSMGYSWYLAVTLPFVRVYEASLLNENVLFSPDETDQAPIHPSSSSPCSLCENDKDLYEGYFSRLNLPDFNKYTKMSYKELVDLHRTFTSKLHPGKIPVKPINFEYYAHSLSTIRSETFHVIQCRDFRSQIMPANHGKMLGEFHRLLKLGGVLELPMVVSSLEDLGPDTENSDTPKNSNITWTQKYVFESMKRIISTLGDVFGGENVTFTTALLSPQNQMCSFLIKHNAMALHELLSEITHFENFTETLRNLEQNSENELHFYFYIRATKP